MKAGKVEWSAAAFEANGMVKRQWLRIFKPAVANCGSCHGLTSGPDGPVSIPEDYRTAAYPRGSLEIGTVSVVPRRRVDILPARYHGLFTQSRRQTTAPFPLGCSRPQTGAVQ